MCNKAAIQGKSILIRSYARFCGLDNDIVINGSICGNDVSKVFVQYRDAMV